jgi:hypothetical protein
MGPIFLVGAGRGARVGPAVHALTGFQGWQVADGVADAHKALVGLGFSVRVVADLNRIVIASRKVEGGQPEVFA